MARITRETETVALDILNGGNSPPEEIRLFPFGKTKTRKGFVVLDADGARAALADYTSNLGDGNTLGLMFDFEHKSITPTAPAGSGKASGWGRLAVRDDGIYAEAIAFTETALAGITAKVPEWRFFSPVVELDENRRIMRIVNIALTNLPATVRQAPIVPLAEDESNMLTGELADIAKRLGLDPAVATIGDIMSALDVLLEMVGKNGGVAAMSEHLTSLAKVLCLDATEVLRDPKVRAKAFDTAIERIKKAGEIEQTEVLSIIDAAVQSQKIQPWQKGQYVRLALSDPAYVRQSLSGSAGGNGGNGGGNGGNGNGGGNVEDPTKQPPRGIVVLSDEDRGFMTNMGYDPANPEHVKEYAEKMRASGYTFA
jgi:hypothetical protein